MVLVCIRSNFFQMKISKNWQMFLLYVGVAVVFRTFSYFTSVLDHDESTYMIIGRDILAGKALYSDVTDTKSAGIFLIYAFLQFMFGYSIVLKRIFASVVVASTAYLINRVSMKIFQVRNVAMASGFIYIYLMSVWNFFGLSPNTELYFNFFTVSALYLLLYKSNLRYLAAGLLFGVGFIIKCMVFFDFVAIIMFLFLHELIRNRRKLSFSFLFRYFLAGLGFSFPFLLENLYFYLGKHFSNFCFITYEVPGRFMNEGEVWSYIKLLLDFFARFLPVSFLCFYVIFAKGTYLKGWPRYFLLVWSVAVLLAVYLPGKGTSHYSIQLMPPLCLIAGLAFHPDFVLDRFTRFVYRGKTGIIFLVAFIALVQAAGIVGKVIEDDKPEVIADYLRPKLKDNDVIFVSNYEHVLYYLLKEECPTQYVHATIFSKPLLSYVFNIDPGREIKKVLRKKPKFILVRRRYDLVQNLIKKDYQLDKVFYNGEVLIYRRLK